MNAGKWMTSSLVTPPLEHQLCRKCLNVVAFDRTEWRPRLLAAMVVSDCLLRAGILNGRCEHVRARLWTAGRPPPRAVQECTRQHAQWSVVLGHTQAHVHSFPVPPDRQTTHGHSTLWTAVSSFSSFNQSLCFVVLLVYSSWQVFMLKTKLHDKPITNIIDDVIYILV